MSQSPLLRIGSQTLDASRSWLMGVVNVTPDSFSDGGQFFDPEAAIEHGVHLAEAGASILDVGGESTRPGARPVPEDEQLRRVVPVIQGLARRTDALISIDTTSAVVARTACRAGAAIVNDISGLGCDPEMASTVAELRVGLCLMHIQGTPRTMQRSPRYADVVGEVAAWLAERVDTAARAGVDRERICVDPGIGFGKTLDHNLALVRHLAAIEAHTGRPTLVGVSRKSFLGLLTGREVGQREFATAAAVTACALAGARIVRVHDAGAMRDVLKVADAIRREGD